ncbi:MAG: prolyl oligopeptidase family serine peptidase [Vicinamibacterales bacterium]
MPDEKAGDGGVSYPAARQDAVSDSYHGVVVEDPYRWLEDPDGYDTRAWVDAENRLTRAMLDSPARGTLRARLEALYNFPRGTAPLIRGGRQFFTFNDGLRDQPLLYVRGRAAAGTPAPPARVLLDPNTLGTDGTTALTAASPSHDGRLLAYAVSVHGSDRQIIHVRNVGTGDDLPDVLHWAKFTELTWTHDDAGFYYTRFPEPGRVAAGDEQYFAEVRYHRIGESQDDDALVYSRPDDREAVMSTDVSADGRWLLITVFRGASDISEIVAADLSHPEGAPFPVFTGFDAAYAVVGASDGWLYVRTTRGAPNARIARVNLADLAAGAGTTPVLEPVIGEAEDTLTSARLVHGSLVAVYLHHASDRIRLADLDGTDRGSIDLPELGSLSGLTGELDDDELYCRFSSFTSPPRVLRYDFGSGALEDWRPFGTATPTPSASGPAPGAHVTRQVWYRSKDGTRVSMFLVHARDLAPGRPGPVLLSAYGGFNISLTPQYDPANFAFLEQGGIVAIPNLRGGGEYGESWHQGGMLERKQNVFDDMIAAAEWLVAEGYTEPARLAIEGGSNGGLLVAAVMVQRPELFGAVICRVPVVDMLRYHRFTVGRFWIPEYGSADDPAQFGFLHAYSPLHNVRDGVRYPPTLVMTADTDDRVDPGMARKFAARLQAATAGVVGAGPILIRVETRAGHGAGKPVSKLLDEEADIHAFLSRTILAVGA